MKALERAPLTVRVWDENFNLIETFTGDKAMQKAESLLYRSNKTHVNATIDRDGFRWSGKIESSGAWRQDIEYMKTFEAPRNPLI